MTEGLREKLMFEAQEEIEYEKKSSESKDIDVVDDLKKDVEMVAKSCCTDTATTALENIIIELETCIEDLENEEY